MTRNQLESLYPNLKKPSSYEITSEASSAYNCIAWAANDSSLWWEPDPWRLYYWPGKTRKISTHAYIELFESLGYEVCEDSALEKDFEKVAIFIKNSKPTHMARQLPSGEWTSKCGDYEDITHPLEGLEGEAYGFAKVFLKRKINQ